MGGWVEDGGGSPVPPNWHAAYLHDVAQLGQRIRDGGLEVEESEQLCVAALGKKETTLPPWDPLHKLHFVAVYTLGLGGP